MIILKTHLFFCIVGRYKFYLLVTGSHQFYFLKAQPLSPFISNSLNSHSILSLFLWSFDLQFPIAVIKIQFLSHSHDIKS